MPVSGALGQSVQTIKKFLGAVSDRSGALDKKPQHFDTLENWFSDINSIKKRLGLAKTESITHATGSRVHGMFDHTGSPSNNFSYAKITDDDLYFLSGGAWIRQTEHSFPETTTWFAEMAGENTYDASVNITDDAATGSTTTQIKLTTNTSLIPNVLQGRMIRVQHSGTRIERKRIIGNSADTVFISELDPLNEAPANGTDVIIRAIAVNLYIAGGAEYGKINATQAVSAISGSTSNDGYDQLDNQGTYGYGFTGITSFANRILGWYGNRVRYSDLANGDNFSKNAYLDFPSTVYAVIPFNDNICVIYEANRIWALIGTSPSSWELRLINAFVGTTRPKTVATYTSTAMTMQIFVTRQNEVRAITTDSFSQRDREAKTLSLSRNYIQESLDATTNFEAGGITPDGKYMLARSNSTWEVLNIEASERLGFEEWVWSRDTRPTAVTDFTTNIFGILGGYLVSGTKGSGQLYTMNVPGQYTDDGQAISGTIARRGLNFEQYGDRTKIYSLHIMQGPSAGSTTMTVTSKSNNTPAGSINDALGTHNPSSGSKFRRYRIKNNPSLYEGSGLHFDYQLTESGSVQVAPIEQIQITYFPGILR